MSERTKPFVAMMNLSGEGLKDGWFKPYRVAYVEPFMRGEWRLTHDDILTSCVVTPLLPDDPRPGEKMIWSVKTWPDEEVTVMGGSVHECRHDIEATSREAAIKKLADALEEVP